MVNLILLLIKLNKLKEEFNNLSVPAHIMKMSLTYQFQGLANFMYLRNSKTSTADEIIFDRV